MRYLVTVLPVLLLSLWAAAQKHSVYADMGIPAGLSATYTYQLTKNLGAGAGVQAQSFYLPTANNARLVPAIFADMHLTAWATKRNRLISFINLGINLYPQEKRFYRDSASVYTIPYNNGLYTGFGLGYFRRVTKRGSGAYVALKLVLNWHNVRGYSILSEREDTNMWYAGGTPAIVLGYKF